MNIFPKLSCPSDLPTRSLFSEADPDLAAVDSIVEDVKLNGLSALLRYRNEFDSPAPNAPLVYDRGDMEAAWISLEQDVQDLLKRSADRIGSFARAQLGSFSELSVSVPGGNAGHRISAVASAGCYCPGGMYPLPSSILMTVIPARVAGVEQVWVATPNPGPVSLAAAFISGANMVLNSGGAQAIAAMTYGAGPVPSCAVITGPGNKYVTAAKRRVAGDVRIDMLAGPSELVILADSTANPEWIAADLIAQAEHDPDALPVLITTDATMIEMVENQLTSQLTSLSTAPVARLSLRRGGSFLANSLQEMADWCDEIAPEHVQICTTGASEMKTILRNYGTLFIGHASAEVLGDYGIGPNHTLPTHGSGRQTGGLSVFDYIRIQTWVEVDQVDPDLDDILRDAEQFARLEGLEGHARAASVRLQSCIPS
ncbi:MAG: histidinol dehydrogenase [Bacteroidetes bacterium]|nr:MAG: histidinol dehydrogenase [Bacteroidota bacterium]